MAGSLSEGFYVEQTLCAGCGQATVRIGLPLADAMRSGGKEPVLCGTCVVALKERLDEEEARGQ